MKVLCSQAVTSSHLWALVLCQVTAKASAPQVPWCVLCVWLPKGYQGGIGGSKAIDVYVFSWGGPRKPACNVVETAQRKSQDISSGAVDGVQAGCPLSVAGIATQSIHSICSTPGQKGSSLSDTTKMCMLSEARTRLQPLSLLVTFR